MKIIITLILSAFLLTSCSNPDTSGGVTLHKRPGDPPVEPLKVTEGLARGDSYYALPKKEPEPDPPTYTDEFPHGDCWQPHILGDISQRTGCGYLPGRDWYVMPRQTIRSGANLSGANLSGAELRKANLSGAKQSWSRTTDNSSRYQ